jgi:2-C-methyl-D-erythritol 2,4-cyclodiphosphate synthase
VYPQRHHPQSDRRFQIPTQNVPEPQDEYQDDPEAWPFPEPGHSQQSLDVAPAIVNAPCRHLILMSFRIGQGFDFHPLVERRGLVLGGVAIPHSHGLQGHSDADVAAHALANAILGALGEGDLGRQFPDTDARYKDADSISLLSSVWKSAAAKNWVVANADVTIFAQRPKLAPYLPMMRTKLAAALQLAESRLNVKASNPEGLGTLGRGEGMAAAAVVLLESGDHEPAAS